MTIKCVAAVTGGDTERVRTCFNIASILSVTISCNFSHRLLIQLDFRRTPISCSDVFFNVAKGFISPILTMCLVHLLPNPTIFFSPVCSIAWSPSPKILLSEFQKRYRNLIPYTLTAYYKLTVLFFVPSFLFNNQTL